MDSKQLADWLVFRTWWTYGAGGVPWTEAAYLVFNLFEGTVWVVLSGLVLHRCFKHGRSTIELVYALAFFSFGLTDYREACALQSWLIWLKGLNLLALFLLRRRVITRHYPESKLY